MAAIAVQIRNKGAITLPVEVRRQYGLNEGDVLTLVDLGDGSFFLTPRVLQLERLGDQVQHLMEQSGVTADDVMKVLAEERERYYRDHYDQE